MIKLIKDLALEAEFSEKDLLVQGDNFQRLAELIVKECLTIVEGYCETSPEIYGLPLDILEHFDMELDFDDE